MRIAAQVEALEKDHRLGNEDARLHGNVELAGVVPARRMIDEGPPAQAGNDTDRRRVIVGVGIISTRVFSCMDTV